MSGGIAQLVAVGAQDAHLVGQPEVSFFRSNYKRHTNFAQTVERQVIQGNPAANGMSTVRFERKGDMLGYVYIANRGENQTAWNTYVKKVELLIGGQVIDEHSNVFQSLSHVTFNQNYSQFSARPGTGLEFLPIRFSFCENAQSALPLIALQYHDVELRITWGALGAGVTPEVYAQFIHLDTDERTVLSSAPQNMLITQTQTAIASGSKIQELNFNHPVKYLISKTSTSILDAPHLTSYKLQINGTDVSDFKTVTPHFTRVPIYYHTEASESDHNHVLLPFCLNTTKLQPTGSLNFSRLDSARLVSSNVAFSENIYGVNYNILRIENGMGGLMYSN
jgi:hypothetical protein